uniref:Ig-like domain-containing protein n=1 Tax=Monopterus albus TaxID=43700 RepID=A0A3Q3J7W4_MONAL
PSARCYLIEITSKSGVIVTLPCQASNSTTITAVEWIRPDLEPEYVLKYQDGQLDLNNQHLSFKDRVELEDSEMKDGDVSLVLRDVTTDDRGTYECHITLRRTNDTVKETVETETFTIKLYVLPRECVCVSSFRITPTPFLFLSTP